MPTFADILDASPDVLTEDSPVREPAKASPVSAASPDFQSILEASPDLFPGRKAQPNLETPTFLGEFGRSAVQPLKSLAASRKFITQSDEELGGILQEEFVRQRSMEQPGIAAKAGDILGGIVGGVGEFAGAEAAGTIASGPIAGPAAPLVGLGAAATAFGASGAYDAFVSAGVRALAEGKSVTEAVKIGKQIAKVGGAVGAATALVLPGAAKSAIEKSIVRMGGELIPQTANALAKTVTKTAVGGAVVGGVGRGIENVAESAAGLDVSPTEGVVESVLIMGGLPVLLHAKELYRQARTAKSAGDTAKAEALQKTADDVAEAELEKVDTTEATPAAPTADNPKPTLTREQIVANAVKRRVRIWQQDRRAAIKAARPEVPGTTVEQQVGAGQSAVEEIRNEKLFTRNDVQEHFRKTGGRVPSNEEASDLLKKAWRRTPNEPSAIDELIDTPRETSQPEEPPKTPGQVVQESVDAKPLTPPEPRSEIEGRIIERHRQEAQAEFDAAVVAGDKLAIRTAQKRLMQIVKVQQAPTALAKLAILPKPELQNLPRNTFKPEVPTTEPEAEKSISVIDEIKSSGAKTIADIQRLFPQAQLNREAARKLRDQAWGKPEQPPVKPKPPEEPPAPTAETVEKPPPKPPSDPVMLGTVPIDSETIGEVNKRIKAGSATSTTAGETTTATPAEPATKPETVKPKEKNASKVSPSAEVHGDVQPQSRTGEREVSVEESSAGVQPQTETPVSEASAKQDVKLGQWPESEWSYQHLKSLPLSERINRAKYLGLRDKGGMLEISPKKIADRAKQRLNEIKATPKPVVTLEPQTLTPAIVTEAGQTLTGPNHATIRSDAAKQGTDAITGSKEGFVNDKGEFVSRVEGAKWFEQKTGKKPASEGELHSEDLMDAGLLKHLSKESKETPSTAPEAKTEPTQAAASPEKAAAKVEKAIDQTVVTDGAKTAKEVKSQLVEELEKAIEDAPFDRDVKASSYTTIKGKTVETPAKSETITIDIPSDGKFTVKRTKEALAEVLSRAKKIKTNLTAERGAVPSDTSSKAARTRTLAPLEVPQDREVTINDVIAAKDKISRFENEVKERNLKDGDELPKKLSTARAYADRESDKLFEALHEALQSVGTQKSSTIAEAREFLNKRFKQIETLSKAEPEKLSAVPTGESHTIEGARAEAEKVFGTLSDRVSFVHEPDNPSAAYTDRNKIVVNAAKVAPGTVGKVLLEEGLHGVWNEPSVQDAWKQFRNGVTEYEIAAERAKRKGLDTSRETLKEEAAISKLLNKPDAPLAKKVWDAIIAALDKVFGVKVPDNREQLLEAARTFLRGADAEPEQFRYAAPTTGKAPIEQYADALKGIKGEKRSLREQFGEAFDVGSRLSKAKDAFGKGLDGLKATGDFLIERFKGIERVDDLLRAKGLLSEALETRGNQVYQWVRAAKKAVPQGRYQAAIRKWVDAGGDIEKLKEGARETKPQFRRAYEDAQNLSPENLKIAQETRKYHEARLQDAIDTGVLEDGVTDYIHRMYERRPELGKKLAAFFQSGILKTNPALTKERVFTLDWQAEKEGFVPNQSFIDAVAEYESSLSRAIAARQFVARSNELMAPDGRPVVDIKGMGIPITDEEGKRSGTLIKPQFNPQKANVQGTPNYRADYVNREYSALSKWKWVSSDAGGKPIFVQGDVAIHPDFVQRFDALLEPSRVRYGKYGHIMRPALAVSSAFKQTMLDLSGFHQVQIAVHAAEHKVLPWNIAQDIDFQHPDTQLLLRSGMTIGGEYHYAKEGLIGSSLIRQVPVLGPIAESYHEWLFRDFIPRVKYTMARKALERNRERYAGKMSEEQIGLKTASQANDAFGGQSMIMLERSKTAQDMARLIMLAPDFLESRAKFAVSALAMGGKRFGNEQRTALLLGALTMYTAARVINQLDEGHPHFEPENMFSWVHNGQAYSLRTVQGDILHLLEKPLNFWMHRLNPVFGRTLLEAATQRDEFGRKRSPLEMLWDTASNVVPISLRTSRERSIWESMANAFGITDRRWQDTDDAFKLARKWKDEHGIGERGEFIYDPDKDPLRGLKVRLSRNDDAGAANEIKKLLESKAYTMEKLDQYFRHYRDMSFTGSKTNDKKWQAELTDDQKKTVDAAKDHKVSIAKLYQKARGQYKQALANPP